MVLQAYLVLWQRLKPTLRSQSLHLTVPTPLLQTPQILRRLRSR
ncbi:hypothetical protein ACIGO7_23660 [Streptomyces virginiae]